MVNQYYNFFQIELFYEANIDPEVKFMAQTGIVGCGWIEIPPNKSKKPINSKTK